VVLEIDKTHFIIRLFDDSLRIDVKGSLKNEIEEALENAPVLRETVGGILGLFVPLHIRLCDIESVRMEKAGRVKIVLPRRRDVIIPTGPKEAKVLMDKLNELLPAAKQRELEHIMMEHKLQRTVADERGLARAKVGKPNKM
jgi:hypothetical protein